MSKKDSHFNKDILDRLKAKSVNSPEDIASAIVAGDRKALAQGITAIESRSREDQEKAEKIIALCMPHAGKSIRIGVTGVPGVGKSTLIESFGLQLLEEKKKVAVLAIDPTSQQSHGSILGDKTRMNMLSREKNAFIRPSPAADSLGGVAQKTREAIILCEAAGFDVILIETVGVGQSEIAVHSMVDFFLLLMLAGAGDELQGIKRGIMEMADLIAINKADGTNKELSEKARVSYKNALHLFPPGGSSWQPPVLTISALEKYGLSELWTQIMAHHELMVAENIFENKRKDQAKFWLKKTIQDQLESSFFDNEKIKNEWREIEGKVLDGNLNPFQAARHLLGLMNS